MPPKSTITRLDPRVRAEVDRLVRDGTATIDEILEHLRGLGSSVSRSAVGRYVKDANEQMEKYRQAQEVARVWIAKMGEEPEGDVGRLLAEMLRTVAFQTISGMGEDDGDKAVPAEIFFLAKAIRELAAADKTVADRELKIREAVAKQLAAAAGKAETIARKGGLTAEAAETIKREILGMSG